MADRVLLGKSYRVVHFLCSWIRDNWLWEYGDARLSGIDLASPDLDANSFLAIVISLLRRRLIVEKEVKDAEESFRTMFENMSRTAVASTIRATDSSASAEIIVSNETVPDDHSPFPGLIEMPYG